MSAERLDKLCYWKYHLEETGFEAASVTSFRSAPLSCSWNTFVRIGMLVEVQNASYSSSVDEISYWWASVVSTQGYIVKLRYVGYGDDSSGDFWMNIVSNRGVVCGTDFNVHPVGWCLKNQKKLQPPKRFPICHDDWPSYAIHKLSDQLALQSDLSNIFQLETRSKFKPGMKLEAVDVSQTNVLTAATVKHVIGPRINVRYADSEEYVRQNTAGFWCHESSPMIHPVGWANLHGQCIRSTRNYFDTCLNKFLTDSYSDDEAPIDCFTPLRVPSQLQNIYAEQTFEVGMKLEFIAHHNPDVMSVGTIRKVLHNCFLMIEADDNDNGDSKVDDNDNGDSKVDHTNQMCYHASSSNLYPAGYAQLNEIKLRKPSGYEHRPFCWKQYLNETNSSPVPARSLFKMLPDHGFQVGQFVEAVDLLSPDEIAVARIQRVVDRLLLIHFEGFSNVYDQWVDCESADIYPIGWCHSVGYHLSKPETSWKNDRLVHRSTLCRPSSEHS